MWDNVLRAASHLRFLPDILNFISIFCSFCPFPCFFFDFVFLQLRSAILNWCSFNLAILNSSYTMWSFIYSFVFFFILLPHLYIPFLFRLSYPVIWRTKWLLFLCSNCGSFYGVSLILDNDCNGLCWKFRSSFRIIVCGCDQIPRYGIQISSRFSHVQRFYFVRFEWTIMRYCFNSKQKQRNLYTLAELSR